MSTDKWCKFFLIFLILVSTKSFASNSPLSSKVISLNIETQEYKMICSPVDLFDAAAEFHIVDDDPEKNINLSSELKARGSLENANILECRFGEERAVVMRNVDLKDESKVDYQIFAKIKGGLYFHSGKSLDQNLELTKLDDKVPVKENACSHPRHENDENYQSKGSHSAEASNLDECLESAQNEEEVRDCLARFERELFRGLDNDANGLSLPENRYGPIQDMGTSKHYIIYLDLIADQYYMRDRTDVNQPRNIRFLQAKDQLEKYMALTNIFFNTQLDLTLKVKRLYTYFGNAKFGKDVVGGSHVGRSIFDDMEDFFEGRPTSDRGFSFLASSITRKNFIGATIRGSNSFTEKLCEPGFSWGLVPEVGTNSQMYQNISDRQWTLNYGDNILFHEFGHQLHQKHNYDYGDQVDNNRDCCQLAFELDIPWPDDRPDGYVPNPRAEERLRSCMIRNYGSVDIDWRTIGSDLLLDNAYAGTIMSSKDFGGMSHCLYKRLTYSDPTRNSMAAQIRSHYRINTRVDGDGDICVTSRLNQLPVIRNIHVSHRGGNNYLIQIDAVDLDQEMVQFRGPDGDIINDTTLIYQISGNITDDMITSQNSEIEISAQHPLQTVDLRVYDDRGDFVEKEIVLLPENIIFIERDDEPLHVDSDLNFHILLNTANFVRAGDGSVNFPEVQGNIELEVDYYGDGRSVEIFDFEDFEDLYLNYPTLTKRYHRSGNFNIEVTLRIGEFEKTILHPIEVIPNSAPSHFSLVIENDRTLIDTHYYTPGVNLDFHLNYTEYNTYQPVDVTVDFGDGNTSRIVSVGGEEIYRVFRTNHIYRNPGTYRVSFHLDDRNGGIARYTENVEIKIIVGYLRSDLPDSIIPGEETHFILRADSYGYRGNLVFEIDYGNGRREERVVTADEARIGVLFREIYENIFSGELVLFAWRVRAEGPEELTRSALEMSSLKRVANVAPEIDFSRYYTPYLLREVLSQMSDVDRNRWREGNPEEYESAMNAERTGPQRVTFKVRFHDLNGPQERFTYQWTFSNGGEVENQIQLDRHEIQGEHIFDALSENQWGKLQICDSENECVERIVFLNEVNRMGLLDEVNENIDQAPQNMQGIPAPDSPFGM